MVGTAPSVTFLPQLLSRTSLRRLPPPTQQPSAPPPPPPALSLGQVAHCWPGYSSYWSTVCAAFALFLITAQREDNMHPPGCTLLLPQTTFAARRIACWQQSCLLLRFSVPESSPGQQQPGQLTIIFSPLCSVQVQMSSSSLV